MFITYFLLSLGFYHLNAFNNEGHVRNVGPEKIYYDLNEAKELFEEFIETYKKEYKDKAEYEYRYEIFKRSLIDINRRNAQSDDEIYGITEFSDLTLDEFVHDHTGFDPEGLSNDTKGELGEFVKISKVPDHWDWRTKGVVSPVKNQHHCQSCWAFSATGCVEGQYAKKHGVLHSLSEQQMVDCYKKSCNDGDWPHRALQAAKTMGGFMLGKDYPYTGVVGRCQFKAALAKVKVLGGEQVRVKNEEDLKQLVYNYGPVSIGIYAGMGFLSYRGGIGTSTNLGCSPPRPINHAMLVVGYGTENNVPYWILKNSAGSLWGEQGYIRLVRGKNVCNIQNYVAVAKL